MQSLPFVLLLGAAALSNSGGRCRAFSLGPAPHAAGRRTAGRPAAATPAPMATGCDGDDGAATKVVVVGGGIAGLTTAHYLATDPGDKFAGQTFDVTVLDREPPVRDRNQTKACSLVNLGNLGPQFTWWEDTPFFQALMESIDNYEGWANSVENGAKTASDDIKNKYLPTEEGEKPWEVGYTEDELLAEPLDSEDDWVTSQATALIEGYALEEENQDRFRSKTLARVDARRLIMSLRTACEDAGVNMLLGSDYGVESLILDGGGEGEGQECHGVTCTGGNEYRGKVVVANGAHLNELLKDVDDTPEDPAKPVATKLVKSLVIVYRDDDKIVKGPMSRNNTFISPTVDGKVLVASRYDEDINTMRRNLESANPKVANLPVDMELALVRCETDDCEPILGGIDCCTNLYFAGAFSTCGMTLAPKSAQVLGDAIAGVGLSDKDNELLKAFSLFRDPIVKAWTVVFP